MITKQVCFRAEGEDAYFGGVLVSKGKVPTDGDFIICGCCGGIYHMDEVEEMEPYENWVNISDEIMGGCNPCTDM